MKLLLTGLLALTSTFAFGIANRGTAFEKDSQQKNILFQWAQAVKSSGDKKTVTSTFTAPDGKVAVTEEGSFEKGNLVRFELKNNQVNEAGSVEVKDGKILFQYTKNGKTEKDDEDLTDDFVAGASMIDFLQSHKATLLKGEKVNCRFAVLDRKETVGFSFTKESEGTLEGAETVTIKMKPKSFVIAALVDPLFFTFRKNDMQILEIVGRTSPKELVHGKWKDLDADIRYYPK